MPDSLSFSSNTKGSKIKRAFCFFHCFARYKLGINNRRSHIGMAMYCLDRTNIVILCSFNSPYIPQIHGLTAPNS